MKILQVTDSGYSAGGAEASLLAITQELKNIGHDVRIFSSDLGNGKTFSDYRFTSIPLTPFKLIHHLFYFRSFMMMRSIISEFKPDIIHFHTISSFSPSVFFAVGNTPAIMTTHGPEEFTLKLLPWLLKPSDYKKQYFNLKYLTLLGHFHYWYHRLLQRPIYLLGLQKIKLFIIPSKNLAKTLDCDIPSTKMKQIYNGVYLKKSTPQPLNLRLLYVGRLEKVKGVDYLIRAFSKILKEIPNASLRIVGDGSERNNLVELTQTLKTDKAISFTGWLEPHKAILEYRDASVLVIPSVWPENLPTVCLEAFAMGRPVIGTNAGGIPELIENRKNGFIVPPNDSDAIATSVIKLLRNKKLLLAMSDAALKKSSLFEMKRFVDKIYNVYSEILNENSRH